MSKYSFGFNKGGVRGSYSGSSINNPFARHRVRTAAGLGLASVITAGARKVTSSISRRPIYKTTLF
jgi:hypothetical protein